MKNELPLPIEQLTAAYDIGPWEEVRLLPGGKSNHFHLTTPRGRYVVRRSYRSKTPDAMRFEHELMIHLRERGFPAPEVVQTVSGDTHLDIEGHLYRITGFMDGTGFQTGNTHHVREAARTLGTYHQLVASFKPSAPVPRVPLMHEALRKRLIDVRESAKNWQNHGNGGCSTTMYCQPLTAENGAHEAPIRELLELLPFTVKEGEAALSVLDRVYSSLPELIVHGGCRRGSFLFQGDRLVAALDFDSSHLEPRVLDVAVALHDFGKIYGEPGSADFKVPLDPAVVGEFLSAYQQVSPMQPAEVEALPALLAAKRVKRGLGRFHRLAAGQKAFSAGAAQKFLTEVARVRWLEGQRGQLQAALGLANEG